MKCRGSSFVIFLCIALHSSIVANANVVPTSLPFSGDTFGILLETANLWLGLPEERNAMVLAKLPAGTKVKILDKKQQYYRVIHKTLIGYVDRQVIGLVGNNLKDFQPEPIADEQETPPQDSAPVTTIDVETPVQETAYFITKATSLRASPTSKARVYLRFAPDDKIVTVLDKADRYWWQVEYKGRTGWVKCALLQKKP